MPSDQKTRQLLGILAQENSKTGKYHRTPAQFRETAMDTHKATPAAYFGPSPDLLPTGFTGSKDYLTLLKSQSARTQGRSRSAIRIPSGRGEVEESQLEYRSVFRPKPDQEHTCSLARTHRGKVAKSEWALLDTLEIQLFNDEREWRQKMKSMTAAEQKAFLDAQVRDRQKLEAHEVAMKLREEELARKETELAVQAEKVKEEQRRERNVALKNERLSMLEGARRTKQQAMMAKQREEAQTMAEIQARMEQEKQAQAVRQEALKQQAVTRKAENDAKIQAKKDADAAQRKMDEEMMQAGFRLAEKQEREREEASKAFHANIQARAKGAGAKVLADNQERLEREARLIKQSEDQKEQEQRIKEEKAVEKRERQKQELLQARKDFLALKEQRAAAAREEVAAMREEIDARTRAEKELEDRKMAAIRVRAATNKDFLTTQIADKEWQNVEDFVGMSEAERQLNLRLLKQASKLVHTPKQLTAKW